MLSSLKPTACLASPSIVLSQLVPICRDRVPLMLSTVPAEQVNSDAFARLSIIAPFSHQLFLCILERPGPDRRLQDHHSPQVHFS